MLRRRSMMAQASGAGPSPVECPYITDGLIFWLDGINRGGVAGQWTDLIGGKTFMLYNVTELANGVTFSSSGYGTHSGPISENWANETIEIAKSNSNIANRCFLCPAKASPVGIGLITASSGATFSINVDGATASKWNTNNQPKRISANNSYSVSDGSSKTRASTDSWGGNTSTVTYLGCRYITAASRYMNGTLYSLRIYNRHLSVAEMQANQAVDAARFNL